GAVAWPRRAWARGDQAPRWGARWLRGVLNRPSASRAPKDVAYALEPVDEAVNVVACVVDGERGARRSRDAEHPHQRLGAVVAGAHADALAAQDLRHVVRVRAVEGERDERTALGGVARPVDRDLGNTRQALERIGGQAA